MAGRFCDLLHIITRRSENFYQYFFQTNKINRTKIKIKFVYMKNRFIFVPVNVKLKKWKIKLFSQKHK